MEYNNYISIRGLTYYYPEEKHETIKDINIEIYKGEIVFICGNSGSGKSTLAKCITGSIPNFYGGTISGDVFINGKSIGKMSHNERASEVTMVFQDPERQLMMNKVHREIAFGLENVGVLEKEIKRRVWEALQFSNILNLAYRDISTLSGGQKQKVAITSAIAYMPKCIILDEPTSQLDPAAAEEVVDLIKKINEELGITIIIIEQRINRWFDIADKVVIMNKGNVEFCDKRQELYNSKNIYLNSFLPSYLKASKLLNIIEMPKGFKDARNLVNKISINIKELDEKSFNNIINKKITMEIKNLRCSYESIDAIKNFNISICKGEFIGILGANGAGKSTLLKAMMGLVKYSGSIKLDNKEVKKYNLKDLAKKVGYVSQNPNDYISRETVYDEIKFTLDNHGLKNYDKIDEVLRSLNIYELKGKNPRDISGGERQRVAIASILVLEPDIILLDEPTRGLDQEAKASLGDMLKKLNDKGKTIILITHDVEFSAEYCRKFVLMFDGEIVSEGNISEVLANGIYYTTSLNKMFRHLNNNIFILNQLDKNIVSEEAKA